MLPMIKEKAEELGLTKTHLLTLRTLEEFYPRKVSFKEFLREAHYLPNLDAPPTLRYLNDIKLVKFNKKGDMFRLTRKGHRDIRGKRSFWEWADDNHKRILLVFAFLSLLGGFLWWLISNWYFLFPTITS